MKILPQSRTAKTAILTVMPLVLVYGVYALSQSAPMPPDIAPVALAAEPLYAQGSGQKPTLTLALSVEFPTVGAQYRGAYDSATEFVGYYDAASCYTYDQGAAADNQYFIRSGAASSRQCGGSAFSGNFLNWASSSSVDVLRLGLTGGDRIKDETALTVLQRAVLPRNFYDSSSYFPAKTITSTVGKQVMPDSLIGTTTDDIKINNCLNQIFIYPKGISPSKVGETGCDNPESIMGPASELKTTNIPTGDSEFTYCADADNGTCDFSGTKEMAFGVNRKWNTRIVTNGAKCDYRVLGDPAPSNTSKKCYIRSTSNTLPAPTSYFARVKVCDSSGGSLTDPRADLCQKYPNGHFKPVGNMQKYSDRVRLAAFGYLMENGNARYGGVLRAPMTFVGPKTYDADGTALAGTNPYVEWDLNTGIFRANPRGETVESNSGVINYLNKFGRVGATPGLYKSNDPVGEVYYESLRYLQGLAPTPEAVSSIDAAKRAGFPAYESWTDPFDGGSNTKSYACLRNSIMLIGDVNTHNDKSLPGNNRTENYDFDRTAEVNLANNIPNFKQWTKVIGGFESNNSVSYTDANGITRNTSNPTAFTDSTLWGLEDKNTGSNSAAYYMAGAAYWARTHDIRGTNWTGNSAKQRPGMRVTTYVLDVNENGAQSTSTDRYKSQFFLTAKYGGFNDIDNDGNPFTPANELGQFNNRHWEKENAPREAKTYFLASDAKAVLKAIDDIFIAATKVTNTISQPAVSGNRLTTDDGYFYLPSFDPEFWSGDLKRNTIKLNTAGDVVQGDPATALSAAKKLDDLSDAQTDSRNIFVGKTTGTNTGYATSFTWSTIETALQGHLNKETPTATADTNGENRLKFIRGYRNLEATTFRKRSSRMGDVVNSGVAYSASPTTRYATTAYKTFYNTNKNRTKAVFVGANDGMLHAFNADTMAELFAYIPSWLGPKLSTLAATDYNSSRHSSYVDATPVVAEAQVGTDWKTVLVSGSGGGGQGVFALDVTNPASFSASNVMWEFTDADDASLGNVVGTPKIVKIRTSAKDATTKTYKWFVVVPSGINNYVNDGTGRFSETGKPALFLLDLSKPASDAWTKGSNYFKIELPISNSLILGTQMLDASGNGTGVGKATGLVNFEATGNEDDSVQYFYFGDLHGQFWKLDMNEANLSSSTESEWNLEKVSYFKKDAAARPMYIAKTAAAGMVPGKVQPISMVPTIAYGPNGTYIVAFGTGKYLEASDNNITTSTQVQSFYALYDMNGKDTVGTALDTDETARFNGRSRLQQGTFSSGNIQMGTFYWSYPNKITATTQKAGWFIDFPQSGPSGGERQITNAALFGNKIFFNSILPPTASSDACGGGASYSYSANLATGSGSVSSASNGALGSPLVFITKLVESGSNSTGSRTATTTAKIGAPSTNETSPTGGGQTVTATNPTGRLSWRQINNYQELKNKSW